MTVGDKVYTVNAKTNGVDSWQFGGALRSNGELLYCLVKGKKQCFLPARCVFESREKALAVAKTNK
jgi:hypothetical protein